MGVIGKVRAPPMGGLLFLTEDKERNPKNLIVVQANK
jgi:hypothetical protein